SYDDYVLVIERAIAALGPVVPAGTGRRALSEAYVRTARGMLVIGRYRQAWEMARRAWCVNPNGPRGLGLMGLLNLALRRATAQSLGIALRQRP
ncbi:MAG: hypothetical protein ACKVQR_16075, partial [Aquabacterium sp.]